MAREFSSADAKKLTAQHNEIFEKLKKTAELKNVFAENIISAVRDMRQDKTLEVLSGIPVEEAGKGIRVKPLKGAGINTMADIVKIPVSALDNINGISTEGAKNLKSIASGLYNLTFGDVKVKLNLDDTSAFSDTLFLYIMRLRIYEENENRINSALYFYNQNLSRAAADLKAGAGGLRRIFLSGSKKEKAAKAYNYLLTALNGQYGKETSEIFNVFSSLYSVSPSFARGDFAANTVYYINTLEKLCPGALSTEQDSYFGLPEEIVKAVSETELDLRNFSCTLRRYQSWGVKYIIHQKRVLLGDEMGLGKTVQAIGAMMHLYNSGKSHFIVICPASVLTNWCREIKKFTSLFVTDIHGSDKEQELNEWLKKGGVGVTTYETSKAVVLPENFRIDMLTVDEAHYIKNPEAKRSISVKSLCEKSDNILFMTGTAIENRVEEMVNLMEILSPETAAEVKGMEALSGAAVFRRQAAPVYLRRRREDVLTELPELIEKEQWCNLNKTEKAYYEEALLSGNFAAVRRVSWHVPDVKSSSKASRLYEITEQAKQENRKIIVFSFFLDTLSKVCSIPGINTLCPITGAVSPSKRQEIIDEFNLSPAGTVLPAQIIAGGTGLNIQTASVVIICEPQLKPSLETQAISRAYRMGQARNVLVHRLMADDTADERIKEILYNKQNIFDAFADKSSAAIEAEEIDSADIKGIMEEEIKRIENEKKLTTGITDDSILQNGGQK